jgi:hypothetical protein
MNLFEFLLVVVSIVLGLGIAELLGASFGSCVAIWPPGSFTPCGC